MNLEKAPDVSVIIPIHGDPIFLKETIKSIEDQVNCSFEIVVVLDRAANWVADYFSELRIRSTMITVLKSPRNGIADALNIGIQAAQAQLIARIDSDDTMEPNRLSSQLIFLLEHPDISVVGTQVNFINSQNQRIKKSRYPISEKAISEILPIRNCIAHPSVMFRKSLFSSGFLYDPEFNGVEDYELWLRLLPTFKIANMPKALTNYRVWDGQITNSRFQERKALEAQAREQHLKILGFSRTGFHSRRIRIAANCLNLAIEPSGKRIWVRVIWGLSAISVTPIRILRVVILQLKNQGKNA
jgi:glycosyltransferase involved in cell wall biosynthesis